MRTGAQRQENGRVAQQLADDLRVNFLGQQQRGGRVPEIVDAGRWSSGGLLPHPPR
jgi:hypothetical protein